MPKGMLFNNAALHLKVFPVYKGLGSSKPKNMAITFALTHNLLGLIAS